MTEQNKAQNISPDQFLAEVTRFSEWRGTVKEALKHLADDMDRREKREDDIFAVIKDVQDDQKACRNRCDKVACHKAEKEDLKGCEDKVKGLEKGQIDQGKLQVKQQVTLAFYGLIGGAFFSLLMTVGNALLGKALK